MREMNGCRPDRRFRAAQCRLTVNRWIAAAARLRGRGHGRARRLSFRRGGKPALPVRVGHLLRLVSRVHQADLAGWERRGAGRDAGRHRLGPGPHPSSAAPDHALHHRGAVAASRRRRRRPADDRARGPRFPPGRIDRAASAEMEWVVAAISAIRAMRAEMNVPPAARVPLLVKDAEPARRSGSNATASILCGSPGSIGSSRSERFPTGASRRGRGRRP